MKAIVLAGGLGTRLKEVVSDVPKPMAPINGRPFLSLILDNLADAGFDEVCIAVCYLKHTIINFFGNSYRGMRILYSVEESPRGTGGAICDAAKMFSDGDFFVINGDTYVEIDYQEIAYSHKASGADISVALGRVSDTSRYGRVAVDTEGFISGFTEKGVAGSGLINIGVYCLDKALPQRFSAPGQFSFEEKVLMSDDMELGINAVEFKRSNFIDIGVPEDYMKAINTLN